MKIARRRITEVKREAARQFVKSRIEHFNKFYNFKFNKIFIKNQKTRWGSCSSLRNLNFNYKIIYLRTDLADYLIVHELCHLGQMNHSKKFKDLVSKTIPNYAKLNKELKRTPVQSV